MKKVLLKVGLFILPLIFLIVGLNFNRTWYSGDPEYAYLLNGINIATFHSVGHTDNPGTPAQIYNAVVLRIAHFLKFSEKNDLESDVIQNPDAYVELERKVSIVLNSVMLLLLGFTSLLILRNFWFSLILQATPFISSNLLEIAFTKVSPEPLLIFTIMILLLAIFKYYTDYDKETNRYPWVFGLLSGFGLATKATFLPLAVLPFLLLKERKAKLSYLIFIVPSFIIFTSPAIPEYPHMAKWFLGLSTHTGTYGQGGTGIIDFSTFFSNIPAIVSNNPALAISVLIALLFISALFILGKVRNFSHSPAFKFLTSIAAVQLIGVLMVAKHYHANHYLIPIISLTGALWIFGVLCLKELNWIKPATIHTYIPPVILFMFLFAGISNRNYLMAANHGYIITNQEYDQVKKRLETEFSDYVKVYYYPVSINPYSALRWGSVYSKQLHLETIRNFYPGGLFYDTRINRFQFWEATIPAEDLVEDYGGKILLVGGPMNNDEKELVLKGGLAIRELYLGRTQSIYEIDTANSLLFKEIGRKPLWVVNCSADTLSSDRKWFQANTLKFQNNDNQSREVARTGGFSVKLPYRDSYAMAIELDSIKPGQQYRFVSWRKGGENTGFLVASSPKNEEFYVQNSDYLKADAKGWKKVVLEITVPQDFKSDKIKFYLWNSGNSPVYFDDFTLSRIQ
jgi:hypothetical protein